MSDVGACNPQHSWRVEGDDIYEPFHNVCEDCGIEFLVTTESDA